MGVLAAVLARGWLAVSLAGATLLGAGVLGRAAPLPDYGPGATIIDTQMQRSHTIEETDVLVLGDSAALYGVDPVRLGAELRDPRVQSLAAIGPARPPGYVKLLRNYLDRHPAPRLALLILHPLGLVDASPARKQVETRAVLHDTWKRDTLAVSARKAVNRWLFGGLLEEPLAGQHGRLYGNATMLDRALRANRGGLEHPAPAAFPAAPPDGTHPGMTYTLHPDGVRDLRAAGDLLRATDTSGLYVALAPIPATLSGPAETASRRALLAETLALLGLPAEHGLELPATLPNEAFVELTHLGADGRRRYSLEIAARLRALLAPRA